MAHPTTPADPASDVFPSQLARVATIRAVLVPRIRGEATTRLLAASKREALLALAPSSLIHLPNSGARSLDRVARLIEHVPCYWLELGRDWEAAVPRHVEELVTEAI